MQPTQLTAASFHGYPPQARVLAITNLSLLRELPLTFVPILLRELIAYDWKLPAERRELNKQLAYISALTPSQRIVAMEDFRTIQLSQQLAATDWVNDPMGFMEQLTASLWSTHQMDRFRAVAGEYAEAVARALPDPPLQRPRLGIVVVGAGVEKSTQPLFRKLRPHGVHFTSVAPSDGFSTILAEVSSRSETQARASDGRFAHWYIDGGAGQHIGSLTQVSYTQLEQPRKLLLDRIQHVIASGHMGPEELRSLLARMKPSEIGLQGTGDDEVLNRFQLSLLTEGSGTQIFATTFVQWAARECLRRAQPETLLVRFTPRQQAQTMNAMLTGAPPKGMDPEGSLIDADMGAYYTWLNMRRLNGGDQLRFLVWYEDHNEALAIGPGLPAGTGSASSLEMKQILALL